MTTSRLLAVIALASASAFGSVAHAQSTTSDTVDLAFMPKTMTVTLLNEGGKYVAVDLKHIPQGGNCRMDEGAIVMRTGDGEPGFTRMRYLGAQLSSGGCPFLTIFDMPNDEYRKAHADFVQKEDEAKAKLEQLKKTLGDKWDEIVGNRS